MKSNKKRSRTLLPLFTALVLLLSCACFATACAADVEEIDTAHLCSLELRVPQETEDESGIFPEFIVEIYRFADIDKAALLTLLPEYVDVTPDINAIKAINGAAYNEELLRALPALLQERINEQSIMPDRAFTVNGGSGKAEELPQGLYLVVPQKAVHINSSLYEMAPFVISLPNGEHDKTPYWQYDLKATLKPGKSVPTGSVQIEKRLLSCNKDVLGGADAVFYVEGIKIHGEEKEVVYNNIVSLHFDAPGEASVRIDGLPEGTVVTVTEVYPGASYKVVGSDTFSKEVKAGKIVDVGPFVNEYDGESLVHSTSVLNEFIYSGQGLYNHLQRIDSNRVKPNN